MSELVLQSDSVAATQAIGRRLGTRLMPGHVIGLIGPLGSGKTTLVKGIAEGAGVANLRQVNSPTFVIVNEYEGTGGGAGLAIHHIDTYRLQGSRDLEALGFDEMLAEGAIVLEWADRVADLLPVDLLTIRLEPLSECGRRLVCTASGPESESILRAL
ncbi:MAG TPA: tRNA (adenosine(37)-N6)-threonylcarbamoyltransferase complex ATPase subunit type 1 TsaE [Phycisphaerae bacterium]|nr:tRNA (adenosine(37)-N6)-threonylcarbamoyltransferase complex ATPase subunit type 1 TsaE [Phycisphaerae bacterium]HRY67063.1 tRNA (adenosine(37)-N6)-threonylcarbamoyltransferase complex ATPase subunit type 1 TsaE [Phycisphaerae bacterium]HSA27760.1 tRNA (adenosine(37)-N6)-threonylcarbamoyltransferase complex ATPase subunit type 1 TsaE [Phycisphaerae bacterium]